MKKLNVLATFEAISGGSVLAALEDIALHWIVYCVATVTLIWSADYTPLRRPRVRCTRASGALAADFLEIRSRRVSSYYRELPDDRLPSSLSLPR